MYHLLVVYMNVMMCHVPYHQQQLLLAYYLDLSDDALRTSFYAQSYKNLVNRQGYEPAVSQSVCMLLASRRR